jgi:imidazolonepropionase
VFGRARYEEQELRATGVPYMEIARRGGGIHASVRDLRARSDDELFALAAPRLAALAASGVTTVEVKSGYGLSLDDELKTLRVIRHLADALPMRVVPTWLGAHEIPLEYRDRQNGRREYIDRLVHEMLPGGGRGAARPLRRRLLRARRFHGRRIPRDPLRRARRRTRDQAARRRAECRRRCGARRSAWRDVGRSPRRDQRGRHPALAAAGTVATLLPATLLFLGKRDHAPARRLIDAGVPVALATDFNPGTSPTTNFPLVLTLGVSQLRLAWPKRSSPPR